MMGANLSVGQPTLRIEPIRSKDCTLGFDCGARIINDFFISKAFKKHQRDRARVFCAFEEGTHSALGFFSITFMPVDRKMLFGQDGDAYREHAPLIYIEWLAVRKHRQSAGIGTMLLIGAIRKSVKIAEDVPLYGVALRPLNERTLA